MRRSGFQRARKTLERGALFAFALALSSGCRASEGDVAAEQPNEWDSEIVITPAVDLDSSPDTVEIELEARTASLEIRPGVRTTAWTYNGMLPGPVIRAKRGDRLLVHFKNSLPEATTIHWHGVRVPNAMDGVPTPQTEVQPGSTFEYDFVLQDAGTYWYHPHMNSSAQVGFGLYGVLIVDDPGEPQLGDDIALVFSDMGIADDGSLQPPDSNGWFGDYFGREGNTQLVNGKTHARILGNVGAPQRWRIVNAARARFLKLGGLDDADIVRIGGDGGLLAHAVSPENLVITPGKRVELWVSPKNTGTMDVQWVDADRYGIGVPLPPASMITFDVVDDGGRARAPSDLRTIEPIDVGAAAIRTIELTEQSAGDSATLGINGHAFGEGEDFHAHVGDTEVWVVRNTTRYDHPFHLHGFFFQVLDLDGVPPPVAEWEDTVDIPAENTLRLAVHFDDRPGDWMFHCHILDHADLGMMGMFMVMPH